MAAGSNCKCPAYSRVSGSPVGIISYSDAFLQSERHVVCTGAPGEFICVLALGVDLLGAYDVV